MQKSYRHAMMAAAVGVVPVVAAVNATASEISIKFSDTATAVVGNTAFAGAAGAAQQGNWNNLDASSYVNYQTSTLSFNSLIDSTGTPVPGASVVLGTGGITSHTTELEPNITGAENVNLYTTYFGANTMGGNTTITLQNIPYSSYDVYVYFCGFSAATTTNSVGDGLGQRYYGYSGMTLSSFVLASNDPSTASQADYAIFTDESNSAPLVLTAYAPTQNGTYVAGLQIVEVPEPASIAVIGTAALGLLARRRRRVAIQYCSDGSHTSSVVGVADAGKI